MNWQIVIIRIIGKYEIGLSKVLMQWPLKSPSEYNCAPPFINQILRQITALLRQITVAPPADILALLLLLSKSLLLREISMPVTQADNHVPVNINISAFRYS
jgi:hypothetical protein